MNSPVSQQGGNKIGLRRSFSAPAPAASPAEPQPVLGLTHAPVVEAPVFTGSEVIVERKSYIMDIETEALSDAQLKKILPPFDRNNVKLGNVKDPEKIKAKIEEAEALHFDNFKDGAALSAITGRVLVIGVMDVQTKDFVILEGEESDIIAEFWSEFNKDGTKWIGHNCKQFDFPFLWRRSKILKLPTPEILDGRYLTPRIIDTMLAWKLNDPRAEDGRSNLDMVSRAFGFPGKNGSGKEFAALYNKNPDKAIEYQKNDLIRTYEVAEALGVI